MTDTDAGRPMRPTTMATRVTGRRVVATVIDGLFLAGAYVALALATGTLVETQPWSWEAQIPTGATIAYGVAVVAYYVLMEGLLGQTIGKLACGIQVVGEDSGDVPGLGAAAWRTLLRLVDGLFSYLVAFVVALSSDRRRRLGDMVAHTLVVRSRG